MFKVIMVPTDGSGFDREAIRVALRLAERSGAALRLVRVDSGTPLLVAPDGNAMLGESYRFIHEGKLAELYALAAECRAHSNANITAVLEEGPVVDALKGHALRHNVDLIVISSHGRGGLARLSLGSVTDSLIRSARLPVLVVKPRPSYLDPYLTAPFTKILVPLDGSELAEQVIDYTINLGMMDASDVTLLRVISPDFDGPTNGRPAWEAPFQEAKNYLEHVACALRSAMFVTKTEVVIGENPATSIMEYAERMGADLIAIATHGRSGLARVLRGSVADQIMRESRISSLVFKPEMRRAANMEIGEAAAMEAIPA